MSLRFVRWASMAGGCAPPLRVLACGAVLFVSSSPPSVPRVMMPPSRTSRTSQGVAGSNPFWWVHAFRSGWPHRTKMRSPLHAPRKRCIVSMKWLLRGSEKVTSPKFVCLKLSWGPYREAFFPRFRKMRLLKIPDNSFVTCCDFCNVL